MATSSPSDALTYALAADLCAHWKQESGKSVISVDDLMKIKEWIVAPSNRLLKYPKLVPLAHKGLDDLIAENYRSNPPGANLLRI